MSIANSTLHFHFPLVAGTDRPLFEDYNATMELLDEKLYEVISTLDVIPQEITDLQDAALSLGGRVTDLETFQTNQTGTNELVSNAILALQGAVAAIPTKFSSVGIADAYDAEHGVYNVGDVVTFDGQRYECTTAVTAAEPFDVSKWNAVDVQTVIDNINTSLSELQNNDVVTAVSLVSYTSDFYTFPSDGYLMLSVPNSGSGIKIILRGSSNTDLGVAPELTYSTAPLQTLIFVKKGMKMQVVTAAGDGYVGFYPLS